MLLIVTNILTFSNCFYRTKMLMLILLTPGGGHGFIGHVVIQPRRIRKFFYFMAVLLMQDTAKTKHRAQGLRRDVVVLREWVRMRKFDFLFKKIFILFLFVSFCSWKYNVMSSPLSRRKRSRIY